MKRTILSAGAVLLVSISTSAAYEADGHLYDLRCTKDGYELSSKYPVSRPTGSGAATRHVTAREKV